LVNVHGTLKLENSPAGRDWKFGLHTFVLLMNAFNFGPSFSTIALIRLQTYQRFLKYHALLNGKISIEV